MNGDIEDSGTSPAGSEPVSEPDDHPPNHLWRRRIALILVVATSIAGLGAALGIWTSRTILDTERFMGVVEPTLEDPDFYERLAGYAGEELLDVLTLEERFTERLRTIDEVLAGLVVEAIEPGELLDWLLGQIDLPTFASLAPTLAAEVEERILTAVSTVLISDPVKVLVPGLVERAHQGLVALALEETESIPNVYVTGDEVRYNLLPYIGQAMGLVTDEIGEMLPDVDLPPLVSDRADQALAEFREALGARVPDDFGQVRLMSVDTLDTIQSGAGRLTGIVWLWVVVTIILLVGTLVVSTNRLRTTMQLALGLIAAFVIGIFILSIFEGVVLNALSGADGQLISSFLVDIFSRLRTIWLIVIAIAAAVGLASYLARGIRWQPPTPETEPSFGEAEGNTRDDANA